MSIKDRILDDIKTAMRAGDKSRRDALRLISSEVKRREVDERVEVDDAAAIALLDKMAKQRRESIEQYEQAGRDELAERERFELHIIEEYLPAPLDTAELAALIDGALSETGARSIKDMGRVMGILKPKVQGRADMSEVSNLVKSKLAD